jgi:hypothetical protein
MIDIEKHVRAYLGDRSPVARPSSFDYCFNYFQAFRTSTTPQLLAVNHDRKRQHLSVENTVENGST